MGIAWSDTWEEISGEELSFKRALCDSQAGLCMDGMFKMNLTYLIKMYAPQDDQITASSLYSIYVGKENVRLYKIYDDGCGWIKASSDQSPWIMFDFLQIRVAVGVVISRECYPIYGVTSFRVSTKDEGSTWSYIDTDVGADVQAQYDGHSHIFIWWFGKEVAARYWRIEPVTWLTFAVMQTEFLGYA